MATKGLRKKYMKVHRFTKHFVKDLANRSQVLPIGKRKICQYQVEQIFR